jgi:hypothetical protein
MTSPCVPASWDSSESPDPIFERISTLEPVKRSAILSAAYRSLSHVGDGRILHRVVLGHDTIKNDMVVVVRSHFGRLRPESMSSERVT